MTTQERYLKTSSNSQKKPDVISIHIGTNDITNDDCSSLQINLTKIRKLVTELSPSTKVVLSSFNLRHDKSDINVKVNRENEIIKQFCKTNKLDLIVNSNIKDKKLYGKKKLHLIDAGKSLVANTLFVLIFGQRRKIFSRVLIFTQQQYKFFTRKREN